MQRSFRTIYQIRTSRKLRNVEWFGKAMNLVLSYIKAAFYFSDIVESLPPDPFYSMSYRP